MFILKTLAVFLVFALLVSNCQAPDPSKSELDFLNPYYLLPQTNSKELCVVDVKLNKTNEKMYIKLLNEIIMRESFPIIYSDPAFGKRILFLSASECDDFHADRFVLPGEIGRSISPVYDYPYLLQRPPDLNEKLNADFQDGTVAVDIIFPKENAVKPYDERNTTAFVCMLNSAVTKQRQYGLPLSVISARDHTLLFVYNLIPEDARLVRILVKFSMKECDDVNAHFTVPDASG